MDKIFFKNSRGDKLCGILSNPTSNKKKPIIILCHGFSTSKEGKIKKGAYGVNKVRAITQDELNSTISSLEKKLRWFKRCQGLLQGNKNP